MIKNFLDSDNETETTSASNTRSNVQLLGLSAEDDSILPKAPGSDSLAEDIKSENQVNTTSAEDVPDLTFGGLSEKRPVDPLNNAESIRMSGMAYSAAIALTSSIVFMLLLGWFADLMFGSSPWGIVVGILFGSVIGFIQFFRISSGIFRSPKHTEHTNIFSATQPESNSGESLTVQPEESNPESDEKQGSAL